MEFFASPMDTPGLLEKLARHDPVNPFCSLGYMQAMRRLGLEPWVAGMEQGEQIISAAGAFVKRGRLNSRLDLSSLPTAAASEEFWSGLIGFGSQHAITQIEGSSFASRSFTVPALKQEIRRRDRQEYVLDLRGLGLEPMSSNHRRNIRKGAAAGLTIQRRVDGDACREHVRLMGFSHERRRQRGEEIAARSNIYELLALLEFGCGELYQAVNGTTVVSSVLVLGAECGAYYQSAGTSPEGMKMGASHFLINGIALQLREKGLETFNLGGAPRESSLARFKTGFGSTVVQSTTVTLYVGPGWRRKLTTLHEARHDPKRLRSMLLGDFRVKKIYVTGTAELPEPANIPAAEFRPLSDEDLQHLEVVDAEFRQRQLERLFRFGRSYAYAVYLEGRLAHVSWLLSAAAVAVESPAILLLKNDQAEITACETLPEFQGKGIYAFCIRNLVPVARRQGITRIYMKTDWDNKPSQKGITAAGLQKAGLAVTVTPPLARGRTWVLRFYR